MKLQRLPEGLYWLPDSGLPNVTRAVSGPFSTREAGYTWLVCHLEDQFTPLKKQLWADAVAQLGSRPDVTQLMGIAMWIARGVNRETVLKAAHPIRAPLRLVSDRRSLAAGDRDG